MAIIKGRRIEYRGKNYIILNRPMIFFFFFFSWVCLRRKETRAGSGRERLGQFNSTTWIVSENMAYLRLK